MSHGRLETGCSGLEMMISQIVTMLEKPIAIVAYLSIAVIGMAIASYRFSFRGSQDIVMLKIEISRGFTPLPIVPTQGTGPVRVENAGVPTIGMTLGASLQEAPPPFEEIAPKAQTTISADIGTIASMAAHAEGAIGSVLVIPRPKKTVRGQIKRLPVDGTASSLRRRTRRAIVPRIATPDAIPNKFPAGTTTESVE